MGAARAARRPGPRDRARDCAATPQPAPRARRGRRQRARRRRASAFSRCTRRASRRRVRPGQFVHLRISTGADFILRRPFSVHRAYGEDIEILYQVLGRGTRELAEKAAGDVDGRRRPARHGLGRARRRRARAARRRRPRRGAARDAGRAARGARRRGDRGARGAHRGTAAGARRSSSASRGGSRSRPTTARRASAGYVTAVVAETLIEADRPDVVCACGPEIMSRVVAAQAAAAGVPCQVSLERLMACGIGACLSCVVDDASTGGSARASTVPSSTRGRWSGMDRKFLRGTEIRRRLRHGVTAVRRLPASASGRARAAQSRRDRVGHVRLGPGVRRLRRPVAVSARWSPRASRSSRGRATTRPRIAETASGMLNSIGLQNPGVDAFIDKRPRVARATQDVPVIVNVSGTASPSTPPWSSGSTPRTASTPSSSTSRARTSTPGGMAFGTDCARPRPRSPRAVRAVTGKPVIVKLTPNVTDIAEIARAVEAAGADAVSLINTLLGMSIDADDAPAQARAGRSADCPVRRSSPSRCAWCGRCTAPCPCL